MTGVQTCALPICFPVTIWQEHLVRELFLDRVYHKHFEVEPGDIVVDVGASVGPFPYTNFHRNARHYFCIEPDKKSFPALVKNTIGYPVTHINKAVWEDDGLTTKNDLYFFDGYVETMRFKTFLEVYGIERIDFLKTDCEGGEYHIFNEENIDFLVENVGVVVGEWHLETPERKESFRRFRDVYLPRFKDHWVYAVDGCDIKWDLQNEHFLEYYKHVVIHINNRN